MSAACFFSAAINGQIEGAVTDPSGALVSGADVEVANDTTGFKRSSQTDSAGFFRLAVLPLGSYTLTVNAKGFLLERRTGIVLNAGAIRTINVALAVAGVTREITVTAAAPVIT